MRQYEAANTNQTRSFNLAWKVLVGLLSLFVLLPLLGIWVARLQPLALIEPPPVEWTRLGALFMKTIALAGIVGISSCGLGTWFAWLDSRARLPGRALLSMMVLAPLAIPSYVLAAILRESFAPRGILGEFFGRTEAFTGFWASACVLTLTCTPYAHLLVASALSRSPAQEEKAARLLGASTLDILRIIQWPRIKGPLMYAFLLITLYVVSDFGAVAVLDCDVLTWELYNQRNGRAVFSIGFLLLLAVAPLIAGVRWLRAEEAKEFGVDYMRLSREELSPLSATVSYGLYALVALFGAVLPILVLAQWIANGLQMDLEFAPIGPAIISSIRYALLGSLATLAIVLTICIAMGKQAKFKKTLDLLVYLPSSLPGILVAVGLLQLVLAAKRSEGFLAESVGWLESTGLVLIIAYATRFLAQAYAALRPGFNRLDPQLTRAAEILGAKSFKIWRRIHLPSLSPSLAVAFALSFLSIAKELPMTLTLSPLESKTLAYRIFDAQTEGALPDVGLASIALLGVIVVMQSTTRYWSRRYE